ncbi:hypothetical protein VTK56DRAFT_7372 [Thermocarpiscus australiensis]
MGWEVDAEHPYKYGPGGYCPIELGDRVANRFIVLHKLGYGGFATVWLVRDEKRRHGRYVALKVVSADWSKDAKFESTKVVDPLRRYERDNGSPGLFVLELERVFHTSRNGRHLCQVFPVLGPALASLNTSDFFLHPSFVRTFAQQLAHALDTMHTLGVCHGVSYCSPPTQSRSRSLYSISHSHLDFTLSNIAIRLAHPLDSLTEEQLDQIFGPPQIQTLEYFFPETPSPAPEYVVVPVDLGRLPSNYLSTRLCIIDFDHAFSAGNAPKQLSHIPYQYLAPENIFTLTNGPPADVWALGCILYELRCPMALFQDLMGSSPLATASRMCQILGNLPREWMAFPFDDDGYHVHEPLQPGIEYTTLGDFTERNGFTLDTEVSLICESQRPGEHQQDSHWERVALLPISTFWDTATRDEFRAQNLKPIGKDDAALFTDLLCKIFDYDHQKRITARQVLAHPWLKETSQ